MTDLETTLRRGLEAYDAETACSVKPDLTTVRLRAEAPTHTGRRWPKVTLAIAAGAVIASGAAGATGRLPAPVADTLAEFRSWGFHANQGAERMASTTDDGITYEIWLAPLDGGGRCVSERVITTEGDVDHGGGSGCDPTDDPAPGPTDFADLVVSGRVADNSTGRYPGARTHATAFGRAPATAPRS